MIIIIFVYFQVRIRQKIITIKEKKTNINNVIKNVQNVQCRENKVNSAEKPHVNMGREQENMTDEKMAPGCIDLNDFSFPHIYIFFLLK